MCYSTKQVKMWQHAIFQIAMGKLQNFNEKNNFLAIKSLGNMRVSYNNTVSNAEQNIHTFFSFASFVVVHMMIMMMFETSQFTGI